MHLVRDKHAVRTHSLHTVYTKSGGAAINTSAAQYRGRTQLHFTVLSSTSTDGSHFQTRNAGRDVCQSVRACVYEGRRGEVPNQS